MKKTLLAAILGFSLLASAQAQDFTRKYRYYTVGANLSASNYFGDIVPGSSFLAPNARFTQPSLGIHASRKLFPNFSVRGSFTWARIKGDDNVKNLSLAEASHGREARNLSFRNDVKELAVVAVYDLKPNYKDFSTRQQLTPYLFAGIAVFHHNPKTYYEGNLLQTGWYSLQPLRTEGQESPYNRVQLSLPAGLGLRYKINRQFDVAFEMGWRKTFTDYLDDVSHEYADKGLLNSKSGKEAWVLSDRSIELEGAQYTTYTGTDGNSYPYTAGYGQQGVKRGNNQNKDWYLLSGFNVTYYLEKPEKTLPKFR